MIEDFQDEQRRKTARVRSLMDFTMGILFSVIGIFFLIYGELDMTIQGRKHSSLDYVIGVLFLAYGGWRIYRGYKKDYFG